MRIPTLLALALISIAGACDPDADGDGVPESLDCNDADASVGAVADDADCDGALTTEDCDDSDAGSTIVADDVDCDGVVADEDCDDFDGGSTVVAEDADCDTVLTADDCDDSDDASTTLVEDPDCNGVPGQSVPDGADDAIGESGGIFYTDNGFVSHCLYLEEDLGSLVSGDVIYGFSLRLNETVTEPYGTATQPTFSRYDIRLGEGVDDPGGVDDDLADGWVGTPTVVRTGSLSIPEGSYPVAATGPAPWGPAIVFDTPYTYTGGNLLIEVKNSASVEGLLIDVFSGTSVSGGTVYNIGDPDGTVINSVWEANWAVQLHTTPL